MMVYIFLHKNEKIIEDTGYIKYQIIITGILLYFISSNFDLFSNYSNCSINFILKHNSFMLIYIPFLIYISMGFRLGMHRFELNRLNLSIFQSNNQVYTNENYFADNKSVPISENNFQIKKTNNCNNEQLGNTVKDLNSESFEALNNDIKNNILNGNKSIDNSGNVNVILKLSKDISFIHSLHMEFAIIYIITNLIFVLSIIFYSFKHTGQIQEYNGKWRYQCPLYTFDNVMYILEILMVIYLLIKSLKVWNYTYIFKCLRNIGYSTVVWLSLGPLMNVIMIIKI